MKTFLKVVVLLLVALVALKLLPATFAAGCVIAAALLALITIGVSAIAVLAGAAVVLAAALSPIWIPVLLVIGVVSLVKRASRRPAVATP